MIAMHVALGFSLVGAALPLARLAPWVRQSSTNAHDSASARGRRARAAEWARDVDGALLEWLGALVHESSPARRAEAGCIAEPFEWLLAAARLPVPDGYR